MNPFTETFLEKLEQIQYSGIVHITKDDEALFTYIDGYAERSEKRLINQDTLMAVASGTKLFTALAIGKLIEEKGLSLDSKAVEIYDLGIKTYDPKITLRHLLSHTSGLPDYLDESEDDDLNIELAIPNYKLISPMDYLPLFPRKPMEFKPGTQFKYNNGAFVYLAILVEKLSGMSYKSYINEMLLKPIGITRSGVYAINNLPENTAFGYIEEQGEQVSNIYKLPIQAGGDGGIYLTLSDMHLLWQKFMANKIISEALKEEFLKPQITVNLERKIYYGLGLWLKETSEGILPGLMGSDPGVAFYTSYCPRTKCFKYIVSNTTEELWAVLDDFKAI